MKHRKEEVKKRFYSEIGLLVNIVKPGYDTSNDGNTARRFFQNPSLSTTITGVDEVLIKRFAVLLETISSVDTKLMQTSSIFMH